MAFVRIQSGDTRGTTVPLSSSMLVGRDPANDIPLNASDVSRRHCRVYHDPAGRYWMEDFGSRNGTFVNGVRQERAILRHGDTIRLGCIDLVYLTDVQGSHAGLDQPRLQLASECELDVSLSINVSQMRESLSAPGDQAGLSKRMEAFLRATRALTVHADERDTMMEILRCLLDIFPQAARAYVLMGDSIDTLEEKGRLTRDSKRQEREGLRVSRTILNTVMNGREAILSMDASADERFAMGMSILQQNIRSMMCVPLVAEEEILGVIEVDSSDANRPFKREDLDLLVGVAGQIALFLRNVTLAKSVASELARRRHLERFFSPAVAKAVVEQNLALGGELREGVIMFCDIVGFTPMSARLEPGELVRRLNMYLSVMVDHIRQEEGTIDKFGGDAILAVWGAPTAVERDARRALIATLNMQNAMVRFNLSLIAAGGEPVGMGIGLHAGRFIAGNIGSEERMEYTVIGSDVNLSQRVESMAAVGMIMASDEFCARVGERLLGCRFRSVALKGTDKPRPLVALRGYQDGEEYVVSLPVDVNGGTPGKITHAKADGTHLELVAGGQFQVGDRLRLEWRTPEHAAPGFDAVVTSIAMGMTNRWDIEAEAPPSYLKALMDTGILESGEGLAWRR